MLQSAVITPMERNKQIGSFCEAVASLEKQRKSKIFCLIHAPDSRPNRAHKQPHICSPEYWAAIANRDDFTRISTLEILVQSPGGHANIAYQLGTFFREHCKQLNYLVPMQAKSAATILCLNGDRIIMGEWGELGPLDVQLDDILEYGKRQFSPLNEFKSMEFLRDYATECLDYFSWLLVERGYSVKQALHEALPGVTSIMSPIYGKVDPSKLGSYRRALAEGEEYAVRLLDSAGNENSKKLAERLVWKYPAHDFVINRNEARRIGLPVEKMELAQDRVLTRLISSMMDSEVTYVGFVSPKERKAKKKRDAVTEQQLPVPAERPIAVAKRAG